MINVYESDEDKAGSMEIDLISNLPDISVLTFIKSLYFMIGAFPTTDSKGDIVPVYFVDLQKSISTGKAVNWSRKMTSDYRGLPDKAQYAISGYGQNNWYLMKSDNLDDDKEDEKDVYESGKGKIKVSNEVIEVNKTIIQLPFNAPYLKNKQAPNIYPGKTLKLWEAVEKDDKIEMVEAKPIIGIVRPFEKKIVAILLLVWYGWVWTLGMDLQAYIRMSPMPICPKLWRILL